MKRTGEDKVFQRQITRRRQTVVSGVRRMSEVDPRRARLVLGWVTVFGRAYRLGNRYVTSQLGQLSPASLLGR